MKKTLPYSTLRNELLADRDTAIAYLNAGIEEGDMYYLLKAIRNVAAANGGMSKLAKTVKMSRTSLYKALSPTGNPSFATLEAVLAAYGIRLGCFAIKPAPGQHKHSAGHGHYLHP